MIKTDDKHLLFIEPTLPMEDVPVNDIFTAKMESILKHAKCLGDGPDAIRYKGFHTCVCGETSTNYNWELSDGTLINSLCVHYLRWHRKEVPVEELEKVKMAYYN